MRAHCYFKRIGSAPWDRPGEQGFSIIDIILTLVIVGFMGATVLGFFNSTTNIDDPVRRFQSDAELKRVAENILADYRNNFWRSWDFAPNNASFDVCKDDPNYTYKARKNASMDLTSSLVLFRRELQVNGSKYGNYTLLGTSCGKLRPTDPENMQQLRIFLQAANNATQQTVTVGK